LFHSVHNALALTAPDPLVHASFVLSCWAKGRWHLQAFRHIGRGRLNSQANMVVVPILACMHSYF